MKKIYIVFIFVLQNLMSSAQINFQSGFGEFESDNGSKVVRTSDGGYCVVGATNLNHVDSVDIAVYFANYLGEMDASVRIGLSKNDFPTGLEQTSDGGFIISGTTYSSPIDLLNSDIFAIKIDNSGVVEWAYVYGGADDDEAQSIRKTLEDEYIIVGSTKSFGATAKSALVLKIDENGNQIWCNVSSPSVSNHFAQADITFDGNYILGGGSFNGTDDDNYILKLDTAGTVMWANRFGTTAADWINDIKSTADSGFIIAGISNENTAGDSDQCVIKLDSTGGITWAYNYGTPYTDRSFSVIQDVQNNYVVCGYTDVDSLAGVINQLVLEKLDIAGNVLWTNIYGDSSQAYEGYYVTHGIYDGYIALGYSVAFGDPNGDAFFLKTLDDGISGCDEFQHSLIRNPVTLTWNTGTTAQLVTLASQSISPVSTGFTNSYAQNCYFDNIIDFKGNTASENFAKVYPNPTTDLLNIETEFEAESIDVYDQVGRIVLSFKSNTSIPTIDVSSLKPGIYLLQIFSKNDFAKARFIKE